MVLITEDLIRKRAEHNEGEIYSLEEVSLHQQNIERIEFIENWCKNLKILYLQNNLIPKIENLSKLKNLEYLNLALNNIEKIENLEGCESLKKLDLTVNFIGDLCSVESLVDVHFLEELYLTGNPCTEYPGYREFVVATLPQLKSLDGVEITKSERIIAFQNLQHIRPIIKEKESQHKLKRISEKAEALRRKERFSKTNGDSSSTIADSEEFWSEKVPYTPESRIETHEYMQQKEKSKQQTTDSRRKTQVNMKYFAKDGRPYNINTAKLEFSLKEDTLDNHDVYILDISVYKHMDTALIECDIQVNYVRVTLKGKVFQLALPDEVLADASNVKRSLTTGHLLITMPKASHEVRRYTNNGHKISHEKSNRKNQSSVQDTNKLNDNIKSIVTTESSDIQLHQVNQTSNITSSKLFESTPSKSKESFFRINKQSATPKMYDEYIEDCLDVPPLI
ncbi:unnamed protein product [Schistosoma turkestanicum]|nr:unnamed protein product [Schistosoma turkestanicum]